MMSDRPYQKGIAKDPVIDDDGMYYDTEIPKLHDNWKLILYAKDDGWDTYLGIYDENNDLVQECPVFSAAL